MLAFGELDVQLRRVHGVRQAREDFRRGALIARQQLEQPRRRVESVVEPVPALLEEDVPAHLARHERAGFFQLRLDQRVSRLPHDRLAAGRANRLLELARALHVVNDGAAGVARQHVAREQDHLAIGPDDVAVRRDHAETIAVAVESEPDVVTAAFDGFDEVGEVLRFARIGMMVRKVAVDLAIELGYVATQAAQQFGRVSAGDPVAAVDGDAHLARELDVADDAIEVGLAHVDAAHGTVAVAHEIVALEALTQPLNRLPGQRVARDHDFQAVVVGRVVAAGYAHARAGTEVMRREIEYRCRRLPDVEHIAARLYEPARQGLHQHGTGQTPVASDGEALTAARLRFGADRVTDALDDFGGEAFADDAANVVGLEDFSR